jgi:hypothetical protein
MKKILSFAIAVSALAVSGFAFANGGSTSTGTVDLSSLPPAQQQAILNQIDAAKKAATPSPASEALAQAQDVADTAAKWAEIGHAIGTTLVTTARDLGTTANQFATTPVGKIVVAIVVWKYLASDITGIVTHVLVGLLFLLGGISLGLYFIRRATLRKVDSEEWTQIPVLWGLRVRQKLVKRNYIVKEALKDSEQFMQGFGYVVIVASVIIGLCVI